VENQSISDNQSEKLGIKEGDIFAYYDGKPISDLRSFIARRDAELPSDPLRELKVRRDGKTLSFMIAPGNIGVELGDRVIQKTAE